MSREQQALAALDISAIRHELEAQEVIWYFVDAAEDFLRKGTRTILDCYEDYKHDPKALEQIFSQIAESHIKLYTPRNWVEPIRVPIASIDRRVLDLVARRLVETFTKS